MEIIHKNTIFFEKNQQASRGRCAHKRHTPLRAHVRFYGRRVARLHRRRPVPADARRARAQVGGGAPARGQGARVLPRVGEPEQPLLREPRAAGRRRGRGRRARLAFLRGAAAAGARELRAALRRRGAARGQGGRARRRGAQRLRVRVRRGRPACGRIRRGVGRRAGRRRGGSRAVDDIRKASEVGLQRGVHRRKLEDAVGGQGPPHNTQTRIGNSCPVAEGAAGHPKGHASISKPLRQRQTLCLRTAQTSSCNTLPALPPRRAARARRAVAHARGLGRGVLSNFSLQKCVLLNFRNQ